MTTLHSKSKTVFFTRDGYRHRITATASLKHLKGNQYPYFGLTADIDRQAKNGRWVESGGGACHDEIAKYFHRTFAPFIKWHLVDYAAPMHYEANTLYWLGFCGWRDGKPNSPPNLDYAKSTCLYGVLESDYAFPFDSMIYDDNAPEIINLNNKELVKEFLADRKAALKAAFFADMCRLFEVDTLKGWE